MADLFWKNPVGIPIPGKTFYHSQLYRCSSCGAAVLDDDRLLHRDWHEELERLSKEPS